MKLRKFTGLLAVVSLALGGCMSSMPEIPPASSGVGIVDVLHWRYTSDYNRWEHALVQEIVDGSGKVVWSSVTDRIKVPGYTPGLSRAWQTRLTPGEYHAKAVCYSLTVPKYITDESRMPNPRHFVVDFKLAAGEYRKILAVTEPGMKLQPTVWNGRVYHVPLNKLACKVQTGSHVHKP